MQWLVMWLVEKIGVRRVAEYGVILVFLVILIAWGVAERHKLIVEGETIAVERVTKANAAAAAKAKKGQDDVAECYDNGRAWDRARGLCVEPGVPDN